MQVLVDENGYVISYALEGELLGSIQVESSEDMELFESNYSSYKLVDNTLVFDADRAQTVREEEQQQYIRFLRNKICFPIVNRGNVWYRTLTEEQSEELFQWYQAWLSAPTTLVIPETPSWIILDRNSLKLEG